jgi:hypothetical protein
MSDGIYVQQQMTMLLGHLVACIVVVACPNVWIREKCVHMNTGKAHWTLESTLTVSLPFFNAIPQLV